MVASGGHSFPQIHARKVIVLDFSKLDPQYVYAIGVVVLALGVTYFLVASKARS